MKTNAINGGLMSEICVVVLFLAVMSLAVAASDADADSRQLSNGAVTVTIRNRGAIITEMRLADSEENWLSLPEKGNDSDRYFGHFLCFDRWGPVTEQEFNQGIPYHGNAGEILWRWRKTTPAAAELSTQLPVTQLKADRSVQLLADAGIYSITNVFENPTSEIRDYNAVEHVLLSQPWLTDDIRLTSNVARGYLHFNGEPVPDSEFAWPLAHFAERTWDLRKDVQIEGSLIASLIFPDATDWAWVCLENLRTHELVGYIWRVADYPWLNLFWFVEQGRVTTRGIEPGTTGLPQPLAVLRQTRAKMDRALLRTLAPGARQSHRLWCLALRLPANGARVQELSVGDDGVRVKFDSPTPEILLPMKDSSQEKLNRD